MQKPAIDTEKLAKVLALTGSTHENEALSAFRIAQRQLSEAGISLADFIDKPTDVEPEVDKTRTRKLETVLVKLHKELELKNQEISKREKVLAELTRQVTFLEDALISRERESEGWRQRAWRIMWEQKTG